MVEAMVIDAVVAEVVAGLVVDAEAGVEGLTNTRGLDRARTCGETGACAFVSSGSVLATES
jgi:hypothetical protein